MKFPRLLFKLKYKRLKEWVGDLEAEKPGIGELYLMGKLFFKIFLKPRSHLVASQNYFHRLYTCHHCPIFDKRLKRCRSQINPNDGCGCYVPFKALAPVDCWLRENGKIGGWGIDDYYGSYVFSEEEVGEF